MSKKKRGIIAVVTLVFVMIAVAVIWINYRQREGTNDPKRDTAGLTTKENTTEEQKKQEPVSIWIMGDSLAAENRKNRHAEGWGTMLQQYLKSDAVVRNAATGGASTSSYLTGGNYSMVMESLQKGDYVIIQFGHNDIWYEDRLTNPYKDSDKEGSFKNLLKNDYIKPIIEKGAHPILATSVVACDYDEEGNLYDMLYSDHAQAMRELVEECEKEDMEVYLVDTYAITDTLYRNIGEAEAWKFHTDHVHYNNYGAAYVAGLIVQELKKEGIECCQDIYTFEEVVERSEDLKSYMEELGVDSTPVDTANC